jgi:hypothetical protein
MFSTSKFQSRQLQSKVGAALCASLAVFLHCNALADTKEDYLKERAVRVIVKGVDSASAASGFLWKQQNWVVTNLHAIPSTEEIKVECGGMWANAKVIEVLPDADLALLEVDAPIAIGNEAPKPPLHKCTFFTETEFHEHEPDSGDELTTYGWLGGEGDGMPLFMKYSTKGTLKRKFPKSNPVIAALDIYGIPSTTLTDFYIFQNGSLPGYSGAAIVDDEQRLVGIVDGGLNEGLDTIKFGIPAKNLNDFNKKGVPWKAGYGKKPKWLWSTGIADSDKSSVLKYRETDTFNPDTGKSTYFDYEWVRTKSLSLQQLAHTSHDRAGILSLLDIYGPAVYGRAAGIDVDPTFDVYQDLAQQLIVAIPAGQGLSFEPVEGNPGYAWLESSSKESGGHTQFKRTRSSVTSSSTLKAISPGDRDYFTEKVSELLADCNLPGKSKCSVDRNTLRIVRFSNDNKILKVGFIINWENGVEGYDYYSFAVRDNTAFRGYVRFNSEDKAGLMPCAQRPSEITCANPELALSQLSNMMAVHLTTFANLSEPGSERSLETNFEYDLPDAFGVGYFDGTELRFYNSRGKIWLEKISGRTNGYEEYERSTDYVWVQYGSHHAQIPIDGGEYFRSSDSGQNWTSAGTLTRK